MDWYETAFKGAKRGFFTKNFVFLTLRQHKNEERDTQAEELTCLAGTWESIHTCQGASTLSETMTFIQAAPRFSQMEKIIYFWQLQKKDKMNADVRITCDLTLLKPLCCKIKEKTNHAFL